MALPIPQNKTKRDSLNFNGDVAVIVLHAPLSAAAIASGLIHGGQRILL